MASIYAYKINYSGMKWAEIQDRYKVETENILKTKYNWTDSRINDLKNPV